MSSYHIRDTVSDEGASVCPVMPPLISPTHIMLFCRDSGVTDHINTLDISIIDILDTG